MSQNLKIYIYRDYETKRIEMKAQQLGKMARGKRWKEYTTDDQLPGGWVEVVATWPMPSSGKTIPKLRRGRNAAGWLDGIGGATEYGAAETKSPAGSICRR